MKQNIQFKDMTFTIQDNRIYLTKFGAFGTESRFVEVQVAGEHKDSHMGIKMGKSSEGEKLQYVSHNIEEDTLTIVQRSDLIETQSVFHSYNDTGAICTYTEVTNISSQRIVLDEVSIFKGMNLGAIADSREMYLYRFYQGHHTECQPRRLSLFDLGLIRYNGSGSKRISSCNVGSWSTKEELPQGIIEYKGLFTMFQIESSNSWYYEISDENTEVYLYLSGPNRSFGSWSKALEPGESYRTKRGAIAFSDSLNGVLDEMTAYRRHRKGICWSDADMPTIFNEYMHLSWDSPNEENTRKYAPAVANMGVDYYVIDCGWHNEEPGNLIYPYVGQWKESKVRFPNGVRNITDYIRSLGMKAGLWIEPEIVGNQCKEMLEYYDDDCFICRDGKKVCTMNRYFLDFRNGKVQECMTQTIQRMVEEYGADYIKLDYNQDLGVGTELSSDSLGEGLESSANAFLEWIDTVREMYPDVVFETCASGGHRLDYETLSHFSIVSTSDQTSYRLYPYIAGNILSAVLPEQAAVWSYPVDSYGAPNEAFSPTYDWVNAHVSEEQVIMNMINSFLGRMHLASHLELLSEKKLELVKEGIQYYQKLSEIKDKAFGFWPNGFCNFGDSLVAAGLKCENRIYLAVWNLGEAGEKVIDIGKNIRHAEVAYPKKNGLKYEVEGSRIKITFTEAYQARFFEIM